MVIPILLLLVIKLYSSQRCCQSINTRERKRLKKKVFFFLFISYPLALPVSINHISLLSYSTYFHFHKNPIGQTTVSFSIKPLPLPLAWSLTHSWSKSATQQSTCPFYFSLEKGNCQIPKNGVHHNRVCKMQLTSLLRLSSILGVIKNQRN